MENKSNNMAMKIINHDVYNLDKFDGSNFTCWKDKMHFLLTVLNVMYVLDPKLQPLPEPSDKDTEKIVANRKKHEEDELVCKGHNLGMLIDRLYNLYTHIQSPKEIWEALEHKYTTEKRGARPGSNAFATEKQNLSSKIHPSKEGSYPASFNNSRLGASIDPYQISPQRSRSPARSEEDSVSSLRAELAALEALIAASTPSTSAPPAFQPYVPAAQTTAPPPAQSSPSTSTQFVTKVGKAFHSKSAESGHPNTLNHPSPNQHTHRSKTTDAFHSRS
ncbi:hypothetical protein LWI28_010134 [Acer negundo]|uniref:Uncharacterized protein n=1 Tax=Acer negundo TaxID=4023 RepID=A0AAD5ILX0_ACENE|nr:hypothetical protein LWI28_010134 [Acer negundo]